MSQHVAMVPLASTLHDEVARRDSRGRRRLMLLALAVGLGALASLVQGSAGIPIADVVTALAGGDTPSADIVRGLRLPRCLMGLLVGASLATGGTVTQSVLRNPLASPFTLGIASGAGFGAALVIWLTTAATGRWLLAVGAFAGASVTALAVFAVSRMRSSRPETLILAGIAVMYLFSALTSLLQYLGPMDKVHAILFWLFGSLVRAGWTEVAVVALLFAPAFVWLRHHAWDFNTLPAGDDTAMALGVNVDRLRICSLMAASMMTAGAICFTGTIGFVGLVGPHMARMLLGSDHRLLLPGSALLGAALVLCADVVGRSVLTPVVIPIGIVTSFMGIPFFVWLLLRRHREFW